MPRYIPAHVQAVMPALRERGRGRGIYQQPPVS